MDKVQKLIKENVAKPTILVGEIRGKEAVELLEKWSIGHPSGMCTLMADKNINMEKTSKI